MAKIITNGDKSGHIDGTGHNDAIEGQGGNDKIGGHSGNDTIDGGDDNDHIHGGQGHDTLTGGSGKDLFVFKEYGNGDSDEITDFEHGDKIGIDGTYLKAFKDGHFTSDEFYIGPFSIASNDYLNYDPTTGNLYYDDDGTGAHKQHLLATFDGKPTLSAHDFHIFLEV